MKSKKVLLGLFVGLLACVGGSTMAQTKANFHSDKLAEVGPNNIGGRVRAIVVDNRDASHQTLYAGGVAGGLYTKQFSDAEWNYVPCFNNNVELTLPISVMTQLPNGTIMIGTGEAQYAKGTNFAPMAPLGRGIYKFNPENNSFSVIQRTVPTTTADKFASVTRMAYMQSGSTLYFYVATATGLYRWAITGEDSWNTEPTTIFQGVVDDLELNVARNMAYFTSGNQLYKIGNATAATPNYVNISGTNTAFANPNTKIELALAPSNSKYLYALVLDATGLMENLYLTKDQQTWSKLTTRTVRPFTYSTGETGCALVVDPLDSNRVFVGGTSIWIGKGYVEGAYYQWTPSSYSEFDLNAGDYMADVFSNSIFVHSGINDIVYAQDTTTGWFTYYVATDGGVFSTENNFASFSNMNRGMNIAQINGLTVCPDGSVLAGAHGNACPFIEARLAHHGGAIDSAWYDNGSTTNHVANIIWTGNGGQVASSMFQQLLPMKRRYIFTSANNGQFGRSYADYNDFYNTQTWTSMEAFSSDLPTGGNEVAQMVLWETTNNTVANDTLTYNLDTNATCRGIRDGVLGDWRMAPGFTVKRGDTITAHSQAHVFYPVKYVVPEDFVVSYPMEIRFQNPIQSRMFAVVQSNRAPSGVNLKSTVMMNWYPTDATKVWSDANQDDFSSIMNWSRVYMTDLSDSNVIHAIAVSQDGNTLYLTIDNPVKGTSKLVRVSGFNTVDYSLSNFQIRQQMNHDLNNYVLNDTVLFEFNRIITSLNVNPRNGQDGLLITFGGFADSLANVVYINNASTDSPVLTEKSLSNKALPVYSAMVEFTTGEVYVGTENGVFVASSQSFNGATPSWQPYGAFDGVPVTAMYQQTKALPSERYTLHTGTNSENYVFAKTKYPYAMYFGTYGRGIFMDSTYVVDHENEIADSNAQNGIPQLQGNSLNSVSVYPNPATSVVNFEITLQNAGNAVVKIYDLSGKLVKNEVLGNMAAGEYTHTINCQDLRKGMYLVNVVVGQSSAATKLVVR